MKLNEQRKYVFLHLYLKRKADLTFASAVSVFSSWFQAAFRQEQPSLLCLRRLNLTREEKPRTNKICKPLSAACQYYYKIITGGESDGVCSKVKAYKKVADK